ncbi:aminoglycoside phosphotransferase family protein [Gallaecimonas sp. GXIMD1310]|uniref:aminoglycoside phosphotransferase family protein n=1 Tax=Gallaecimonas sp. GXIMD1310 TaxID=3131926 RepID=UPI003247BA57
MQFSPAGYWAIVAAMTESAPETAALAWASAQLGQPLPAPQALTGDAGSRRYWRLHGQGLLVAYQPGERQTAEHFQMLAKVLRDSGVRVPAIRHYQFPWMLVEDLGATLLSDQSATARLPWYRQAVTMIAAIQQLSAPLPALTPVFVSRKKSLFSQWYYQRHLGHDAPPDWLDSLFAELTTHFFEQPQVPAHRDFHARNLLCHQQQLAVIDFQDMQQLPLTYDLASLLRDSYVSLTEAEEEELLQQAFLQQQATTDRQQFVRWLDYTGLLRQLKILGIFCRLHYRDGKPGYMASLAPTLAHIQRIARRYPSLAPLLSLQP